MYYVFYGNDATNVRKKAFTHIASFENKGFLVERIDADAFEGSVLQDAAGATSLFGEDTLYLIDTPSSITEFYESVIESLPILKESNNTFVIIEEKLLAPEKKKFEKLAESINETKGEAEDRFNAFSMADALASKDKKNLWLLLQEAKKAGLSSEEIIGTLWWQLKSLRLAQITQSSTEAGMKDFPYNKAKRSLSKFKEGEVEKLSQSLLSVYHKGHLGILDIELSLEKWILSV